MHRQVAMSQVRAEYKLWQAMCVCILLRRGDACIILLYSYYISSSCCTVYLCRVLCFFLFLVSHSRLCGIDTGRPLQSRVQTP